MTTLDLSDDQAKTLKKSLTSYLSDLRLEIAATENHDFREELKKEEEILHSILAKLE